MLFPRPLLRQATTWNKILRGRSLTQTPLHPPTWSGWQLITDYSKATTRQRGINRMLRSRNLIQSSCINKQTLLIVACYISLMIIAFRALNVNTFPETLKPFLKRCTWEKDRGLVNCQGKWIFLLWTRHCSALKHVVVLGHQFFDWVLNFTTSRARDIHPPFLKRRWPWGRGW